jgi:hypothetical protein
MSRKKSSRGRNFIRIFGGGRAIRTRIEDIESTHGLQENRFFTEEFIIFTTGTCRLS